MSEELGILERFEEKPELKKEKCWTVEMELYKGKIVHLCKVEDTHKAANEIHKHMGEGYIQDGKIIKTYILKCNGNTVAIRRLIFDNFNEEWYDNFLRVLFDGDLLKDELGKSGREVEPCLYNNCYYTGWSRVIG